MPTPPRKSAAVAARLEWNRATAKLELLKEKKAPQAEIDAARKAAGVCVSLHWLRKISNFTS